MLRSGRNFGGRAFSAAFALVCDDPSLTRQSEKQDADINVIVKRFAGTGMLPQVQTPPTMQEFADVFDFQSAMNVLVRAREAFMTLDADTRARFHNDPGRFVEFVEARGENGERVNIAELRKMGLAPPEAVVVESPPMRVEVVNAQAAKSGDAGNGGGV